MPGQNRPVADLVSASSKRLVIIPCLRVIKYFTTRIHHHDDLRPGFFLLFALCTVVTLITAGVLAIRRRFSSALRVLRNWVVGTAVYFLVSVSVSWLRPRTLKSVREPWCFDDWCLTVEGTQISKTATANTYTVDLMISSRARQITQRAKGAWIYLVDQSGRRFPPDPEPSTVPLDVLLQPQQSIATVRTFRLPPDARAVGLVTGHGGPYCGPMNFLVIGNSGCVFHKPRR